MNLLKPSAAEKSGIWLPPFKSLEGKEMSIDFVKWYGDPLFHSPIQKGELVTHKIEFRKDPLLGHVSVHSDAICGKREIMFPPPDENYIKKRIIETQKTCFLCDGKWKHTTPKYPEELISDGRLIKNKCVLFPNLFPISNFHAVVMMGEDHYLDLDQFSEDLLYDALSIAFEFIEVVTRHCPEIGYFTINANYLAPSGASLMHPHLQVLGADRPVTHHEKLLRRSREFFEQKGKSYWEKLVEEEKVRGERYIKEYNDAHLIAAYSPLGINEVLGIWPHIGSFDKLRDQNIKDMSKMISETLAFYKSIGFSTFNFSCFGEKIGAENSYSACVLRMVCRQNMVPDHRTDDYYFQKLLESEIMVISPEELARSFRELLLSKK